MRLTFGILLATVAAIAPANAAERLASPLGKDPNTNQVACYLANVGTGAITVSNATIALDDGLNLVTTVNSCGSRLAGGRTCVWATNLAGISSKGFACRIDLSSKANARGALNLRFIPAGSPPRPPILLFSLDMQ
jgi:hypothetical protein